MNAKIHVVGINRRRDAMMLKEKLMQARREAGQEKHKARVQEKEALVQTMTETEANFIAQGMSQA